MEAFHRLLATACVVLVVASTLAALAQRTAEGDLGLGSAIMASAVFAAAVAMLPILFRRAA